MILFILLNRFIDESTPKQRGHQHQFDTTIGRWVKAPRKGGGYVGYFIMECQGNCGKVKVDPKENFGYCTDEHKEGLIEVLQKSGLSLIEDY